MALISRSGFLNLEGLGNRLMALISRSGFLNLEGLGNRVTTGWRPTN